MKTTLKNELLNVIIVLFPIVYLGFIWNRLPESVPLHWNLQGEADRFGDKAEIWIVPILLPLLTYIIFLFIPRFAGSQINQLGMKFERLKTSMVLLTSVLASFIIFAVGEQAIKIPAAIPVLVGLIIAVSGNYFPVLKQNLFFGIKTPWTMRNTVVWDKTHRMASKYWFWGGVIIVISSLFLDHQQVIGVLLIIVFIISIIPVVYSYVCFQKIRKGMSN